MRTITIINQSTVVPDQDCVAAMQAIQTQMDRDFAPTWSGLTARMVPSPIDLAGERIYILDNSDQADALGYHDFTDEPVGFVFAKTTMDVGYHWATTFSHEALEQLLDPWVALGSMALYQHRPAMFILEDCDPVEADVYDINGFPVSNFITPNWFIPGLPRGSRYDFMGTLTEAMTISQGGYFSYTFDMRQWQQVFGSKVPSHKMMVNHYSRRERRIRKRAKRGL